MRGGAETSSIHYQWTYDVFINFRGEDTRYGFTGHLNKALNEKGVRTIFDDNEIGIGDEISPTLFKAINESRTAITVFSENYASSTFCLNELVQIHQCIKKNGRLVWPIFYGVEPSEVRYQRGNYGKALVTHKEKSRADDKKIECWKHALREVANLKGSSYDPRTRKGVYEHELIEEVVNHILRLIKRVPLYVAEYPVGLYSRVEKIRSLLQLGSNDKVIVMGICGTGGMGKTTIACAVYNAIADHFDYLCFLDDIKGESEKHGLKQEQAKMLSKILGQKQVIEDINEGIVFIKRILKGKKVLLILDNVDEQEQLKKLAGACDWFGSGSRIIITTRDLQLLKRHGIERIYEMEGLNHEESLELLSWNAFRKMQVDDLRYKDVVERVISYAGGLPLALELIGSDLYRKNVKEWESKLDGCKKIPHDDIQQKLRMVRSAHDLDPDYQIGVLADKDKLHLQYRAKINCHMHTRHMKKYTTKHVFVYQLEASQNGPITVAKEVFINDELAYDGGMTTIMFGSTREYHHQHICVYYIWHYDITKSFEEDQWNHAEICHFSNAKESGIYVVRDEWTNMENIRFTDPFQSSDSLRGNDQGMVSAPLRFSKKRKRNCLMKRHENNSISPNANHRPASINNQGCTAEKTFSPSQSEQQHTHSQAVLDIDSLKRLSAACRRLKFPIKIRMNREIMGSQLEYDFYINEEDVMEFLSMQELCITIIQLFLMFCKELCIFRGIDDRFGFLCPNAVQGMGRTRKDRISYIESTIKESNKQCWLAPIHEGNHWTLCAICPELNIIYWFDSLGGKQSSDIEKVFTEALKTYQNIGAKNTKWLYPNCHRQVEDKECGYYIMRCMYDIIDMNEVHSFDMEDIINIQNKWSAYLLDFHATHKWRTDSVSYYYKNHVEGQLFGLTSLSLCNGKDKVCWEDDIIGKYSVKQGYPLSLHNAFIIRQNRRKPLLDLKLKYYLFRIELPHNQLLFIWKLIHSLVPIGEDVQVYCVFGCQAVETIDHLFCSCPYIKAIWFGALSIRFDKLPSQGFPKWLLETLREPLYNGGMAMLKGIIILLNLIWTKRNMTLHTGLICNPEEVIRDFQGSFVVGKAFFVTIIP